jgi:hypothetical protein
MQHIFTYDGTYFRYHLTESFVVISNVQVRIMIPNELSMFYLVYVIFGTTIKNQIMLMCLINYFAISNKTGHY